MENKDVKATVNTGLNEESKNSLKSEKPVAEINEANDVVDVIIDGTEEEISNVIELTKKYRFEDKVIAELDLKEIENLSANKLQEIEGLYRKTTKNISSTPELTIEYAMALGSILTGLPLEFFKQLNARDVMKIKTRVINFLYGD